MSRLTPSFLSEAVKKITFSNLFNFFFISNRVMIRRVFSNVFKQVKILNSVIIFYLIDMMYNFTWTKKSFKIFFGNKPMLKTIISFNWKWMVRIMDKNISTNNSSATFPLSISFTIISRFTNKIFRIARMTAEKTITFFNITRKCFKSLRTILASSFDSLRFVLTTASPRTIFTSAMTNVPLGNSYFLPT